MEEEVEEEGEEAEVELVIARVDCDERFGVELALDPLSGCARVESLTPDGPFRRAGCEVGDVLRSCGPAGAGGPGPFAPFQRALSGGEEVGEDAEAEFVGRAVLGPLAARGLRCRLRVARGRGPVGGPEAPGLGLGALVDAAVAGSLEDVLLGELGGDALGGDAGAAMPDRKPKEVDLLLRGGAAHSGSRTGDCRVYTRGDGAKVPCTLGEHYYYRDPLLNGLNATEFNLMFKVQPMNDADREWYQAKMAWLDDAGAGEEQDGDADCVGGAGAGRRRHRFYLRRGHPLHDSHLIVWRAKVLRLRVPPLVPLSVRRLLPLAAFRVLVASPAPLFPQWGVPAFAGAPPPKLPTVGAGRASAAATRQRRQAARWFLANFKPWGVDEPPVLTYEALCDWLGELRAVGRVWVPDETPEARRRRYIAHGRLSHIENVREAFCVDRHVMVMHGVHRARARHLWGVNSDAPAGPAGGGGGRAADRRARKSIAKIRAAAEKYAGGKPKDTRLNAAGAACNWATRLEGTLPPRCPVAAGAHGAGAGDDRVRQAWPHAAEPTWAKASRLGFAAGVVGRVSEANGKPLAPDAVRRAEAEGARQAEGQGRGDVGGGGGGGPRAASAEVPSASNDPCLAPLDDNGYERAAAAWAERRGSCAAAGVPFQEEPPMNPEQRVAAREFMRVVELREAMLRGGATPVDIDGAVRGEGLSPVQLVMGPGGTGKSMIVHFLQRSLASIARPLVVTAYTGVAAAPFGGPTILSLFDLGIEGKSKRFVERLDAPRRDKKVGKFKDECGWSPCEIGGLVIDEVSFNDAALFGHVDHLLRELMHCHDVPFGGIPLLLLGDNKQKPPPCSTPWFSALVARARDRGLVEGGYGTATEKGLTRIADARLTRLTRIMRSVGDQEFVKAQVAMRDSGVDGPVAPWIMDRIPALSPADAAEDPRWRFAPIGVLSKWERDVLNKAQAERFAEYFGLPLVRWRLPIADEAGLNLSDAELSSIYDSEPGLWGYFVEGMPVHLTKNIRPVRKLVNGSPGLQHSLSFENGDVPSELGDALAEGGFRVVTLDRAPHSVNVRVGGGLWHGIELGDLSQRIESMVEGEQVVPILRASDLDEVKLRGFRAAEHDVAWVFVKSHKYLPAFAMTDFKLQGRTLERLVVSLGDRPGGCSPPMQMNSLYVLISRVTSFGGLRLLEPLDPKGLAKLCGLSWSRDMYAWDNGYDDRGMWDAGRARAAWAAFERVRGSSAGEAAAVPTATRGGSVPDRPAAVKAGACARPLPRVRPSPRPPASPRERGAKRGGSGSDRSTSVKPASYVGVKPRPRRPPASPRKRGAKRGGSGSDRSTSVKPASYVAVKARPQCSAPKRRSKRGGSGAGDRRSKVPRGGGAGGTAHVSVMLQAPFAVDAYQRFGAAITSPPDAVVRRLPYGAGGSDVALHGSDFRRFQSETWLNDELVNAYMYLLGKREASLLGGGRATCSSPRTFSQSSSGLVARSTLMASMRW